MAELPNTIDAQLRPEHAALVVVDMQNDFCAAGGYADRVRQHNLAGMPAIAANINRLVDAARAAGMPVFWIRAIYDFKYLNEPARAKRGPEGCCLEGTWGADFYAVQPAPGEPVIDKHSFNAFHETTFERQLRSRGIKTLVMSGVATNVCVESTLRAGFFLGYHIVLAEDCVGSNNRVGHEGTLATVRTNFGSVLPAQAIIDHITATVA